MSTQQTASELEPVRGECAYVQGSLPATSAVFLNLHVDTCSCEGCYPTQSAVSFHLNNTVIIEQKLHIWCIPSAVLSWFKAKDNKNTIDWVI